MKGRAHIGMLKKAQSSFDSCKKICELLCNYQQDFDYLAETVDDWNNLIQEIVINGTSISPKDMVKIFKQHLNHNFYDISACWLIMFIISEHQIIAKVLDVMDRNGLVFNIVPEESAVDYINDKTILDFYFEPVDEKVIKKVVKILSAIKGPYSEIEVHTDQLNEEANFIRINLTKEGKVIRK